MTIRTDFGQTGIRAWLYCLILTAATHLSAASVMPGNRLAYLDDESPFYPNIALARLTTPQWIGEPGVEAVVTLGIDDLGGNTARYESFLEPVIARLLAIDGRAPVSIFCNAVTPDSPKLKDWLGMGLSLEVHTLTHPCPILATNGFDAAVNSFRGSVDLLKQVPGNVPVAFRVPCCDSINSPSPRLYSEIFPMASDSGTRLQADSSVMVMLNAQDPVLPESLVGSPVKGERFRRYLNPGKLATTIDNHPYPYPIRHRIWELPTMVPSDWQAQDKFGTNQPSTLDDWKAALDAIVLKQGTFNLIHHPHGWIHPQRIVDLIQHAVATHGQRVKFLNFREVIDRLTTHLLAGTPLLPPEGQLPAVRFVDLNRDTFMDVLIGSPKMKRTRVWNPALRSWSDSDLPVELTQAGVVFGVVDRSGDVSMVVHNDAVRGAWTWRNGVWVARPTLLGGLEDFRTAAGGLDRGARMRDVDGDGTCEWIVGNPDQQAVLKWTGDATGWTNSGWHVPAGWTVVDGAGHDAGLRWVDLNGDGALDLVHSGPESFGIQMFVPVPFLGWTQGWTRQVASGGGSLERWLPAFVARNSGASQGAWFHRDALWMQNESTAHLPDLVFHRTFAELLAGKLPVALTPEESLAAIQVRRGFTVDLVASEPHVLDPVAFEWDERGRLWVAEMGDYPRGTDGKGARGGEIRLLEDTDGDGRMDRHQVFADGLGFPTGVFPWRNGLIVSAAPDILFLSDTNRDGVADHREVWFTGFREGNQQHRVNGFEWGLDGWIYGANGDSGGRIRVVRSGREVSIDGQDFRFKPDTGEFEAIEGVTQFGRRRDDFGHWFGNHNGTWGWHYPIAQRYLDRNSEMAQTSRKNPLSQEVDWTRVFPISEGMQRMNVVGADFHNSSACSFSPYRDDLFGPAFARAAFVSEPVYNVVHCEILEPAGNSWSSHRMPDDKSTEFLASRDPWFRPTSLKTGPDGALYVADMYRMVIEHPEWIPPDLFQHLNVRAGADKGRIYRVHPSGTTLRRIPGLTTNTPAALCGWLNSPNGWMRDTAQRLIADNARSWTTWETESAWMRIVNLLESSPRPGVRIQALWTLEKTPWRNLIANQDRPIATALRDSSAEVRKVAVQILESRLSAARISEALARSVPFLTNEPSSRVRFQWALSLGEWKNPEAARLLARIAVRDGDDPLTRTAVISSLAGRAALVKRELTRLDPAPRDMKWLRDALAARESIGDPEKDLEVSLNQVEAHDRPKVSELAERSQLTADWIRKVTALTGDPERGQRVFEESCAGCHQRAGLGRGGGPNLASLSDVSISRIVTAVMHPNLVVDDRYRAWTVTMKSGAVWSGWLAGQSRHAVDLWTAAGSRERLPKKDIVEAKRSARSPMPEGLESNLEPQALADLISWMAARTP